MGLCRRVLYIPVYIIGTACLLLISDTLKAESSQNVNSNPRHQHALAIDLSFYAPLPTALNQLVGFIDIAARYQFNPRFPVGYLYFEAQASFLRLSHVDKFSEALYVAEVALNIAKGFKFNDSLALLTRIGIGGSLNWISNSTLGVAFKPTAHVWAGMEFSPNYSVGIELGLGYHIFIDPSLIIHGVQVGIAFTYRLGKDPTNRDLRLENIRLEELFAARMPTYTSKPLGTLTIRNTTKRAISDIRASIIVDGLIAPVEVEFRVDAEPNEMATIPIHGVPSQAFANLNAESVQSAKLQVSYTMGSELKQVTFDAQIRLHGRNAISWEDTRSLGSFVTSQDPSVQQLTRSLIKESLDQLPTTMNRKFGTAIAIYAALQSMGIRYLADPNSPFSQVSNMRYAVDYVQYPRDLLLSKTGDCDDLVTLFAAMLENAGVNTALITVPGHIFLAFNTDDPVEYRLLYGGNDMVMPINGQIWIPIELTLLDAPFKTAWEHGARIVSQYSSTAQYEFIPVAMAWQSFPSLSLPTLDTSLPIPTEQSYAKSLDRNIGSALSITVAHIEDRIEELLQKLSTQGESVRVLNEIGILSAQAGKIAEAATYFERALVIDTVNINVMLNLGSLYILLRKRDEASHWLEAAKQIAPDDPAIQETIDMLTLQFQDADQDLDNNSNSSGHSVRWRN